MGLFENLKLDEFVETAKQLAEIAKLKANNISEEDEIKKAYLSLGKLYYAERGMAPEAAYSALCEKITRAKVNIEENRSRMEQLKSTSGLDDFVEDAKEAGTSVKEKVKSTVEAVKHKGEAAEETAAQEVQECAEEVQECAEEVCEKVADAAEEVAETVTEEPKE